MSPAPDASANAPKISVRGAREHNLKNISIEIPRDRLVVFTGLSGSGKSSLAFDTIYAEGQRRYVESLSSYARQFLGQMDKPDVDIIEGLSPAIAIDQKSAGRNPRSTVGTITEVYDYLRLLFARIGVQHCPLDGTRLSRQTPSQIVDRILLLPEGTRFQVLAPVVRGRKGEYDTLLQDLTAQGFVRARIDGEVVDIAEFLKRDAKLARYEQHRIEIIADFPTASLADEQIPVTQLGAEVEQPGPFVRVLRTGDPPLPRGGRKTGAAIVHDAAPAARRSWPTPSKAT